MMTPEWTRPLNKPEVVSNDESDERIRLAVRMIDQRQGEKLFGFSSNPTEKMTKEEGFANMKQNKEWIV